MVEYDVVIAGGGIAGSVAAKYTAQGGLKTLLVEREKTPRDKACSGIQFPYFERLIGEKIPRSRLCNTELNKVKVYLPDGKSFSSPFRMLNFMRKPFDDWLNQVAVRNGAEFVDECILRDFSQEADHVSIDLQTKDDATRHVKARYLVDAEGMRSRIRMKMRPEDFQRKSMGATLNYYVDGTADLDESTLYQFWNLDWCDAMFAWVYTKTLDDEDRWVVGTGCNTGKVLDRQNLFFNHITRKFNLKGTVVKKEGYSHSIDLSSENRIWLGGDRILAVGDAAGLVDESRGVGMDSAALSARLAAEAIVGSNESGASAYASYTRLMESLVTQSRRNQGRDIGTLKTNEDLQKHLESTMPLTGVKMLYHSAANRIQPLHKIVMLPP